MSEAVYICDDNFHLIGEASRVCQSDGNCMEWEHTNVHSRHNSSMNYSSESMVCKGSHTYWFYHDLSLGGLEQDWLIYM